jgi:acyl-CoA reductase-like NAD-dependent aldehyde dehydrogenase
MAAGRTPHTAPAQALASINPATGETVRTFEALAPAQIEEKLARAADAFRRWRRDNASSSRTGRLPELRLLRPS